MILFCTQFVRVRSSTDPAQIYELLTEQWGLSPPHLVVALVGGDELTQMKPWLRDTVRKGLVKAAQSTGMTHTTVHICQKSYTEKIKTLYIICSTIVFVSSGHSFTV